MSEPQSSEKRLCPHGVNLETTWCEKCETVKILPRKEPGFEWYEGEVNEDTVREIVKLKREVARSGDCEWDDAPEWAKEQK